MYKNLFQRANEVAYLDTAAEGLLLPQVEQKFREYCYAKASGACGRVEFHAIEAEALRLVACLLGTETRNVALLSSASDALNLLALSIDWKPGDQVVTSDLEFPSNVLPWVRLKKAGVDLVVIPTECGGLRCEQVIERIGPRTRIITLSLVSYKTGAFVPGIPKIKAAARKVGAMVCVDATQALGRCPVSIEGVDYLVSSAFKWLLGPHGLSVVYVAPDFQLRFEPARVGWYSVKDLFALDRFDSYRLKDGTACLQVGSPNFPSIYGLLPGMKFLLEVGIHRIHQELRPVVKRLWEGLSNLGLDLLTPQGPEFASGIVSFAHPEAEEVGAALKRKGVIVWVGDGRIRASVHVYNDVADIDRCVQALKSILNR